MKKNIFVLFLIATLFSSNTQQAKAWEVVFDPTSVSVEMATKISAAGTWIASVATQASTYATSFNTYMTMINTVVIRPLKDAMTLLTIIKNTTQITNLVTGSIGGDSLLVANPGEFIKNKATNAVRANYNEIANQKNGVYTDSLLNTLMKTTRANSNTQASIAALNQSSIPSTVQKKFCDDNTLSVNAEDQATKGGTIPFDEATYKATKKAMYANYCAGNPATDKVLSDRLLNLNSQNPSIGGWDSWLAMTGGENAYTKNVQVLNKVQEEAAQKADAAQKDLAAGGGIKSATICTSYGRKDPKDTNSFPVCLKESVVNPGAMLKDAFSEAKTAALKTAENAFGSGGDGGSFFSNIMGIIKIGGDVMNTVGGVVSTVRGVTNTVNGAIGNVTDAVNTVTGAVDSVTGTIDNTVSQIDNLTGLPIYDANSDAVLNARRTAPTMNSSTVTSGSNEPDLETNPQMKTSLITPIQNLMSNNLTSIDKVIEIDNNYITEINYYISSLGRIKSCYDSIDSYARASNYNYTPSVSQSSALSFYMTEMASSQTLLSQMMNDRNIVLPSAKKTTSDLLAKINTSNSSEEISGIFNTYQNKMDDGSLPGPMLSAQRSGEYNAYKQEIASRLQDIQGYPGVVIGYINQCNTDFTNLKMVIQQSGRSGGSSFGN